MPPLESLAAFVVAGIVLNLVPGPDVLYIVGRSLAQGRAAGIVSCLGIAAGCLVHVAAATLGLSALMLALPHAYDVVRWGGAAYLVWIGAKLLLAKSSRLDVAEPAPVPLGRVFRQGAITNILNPKIALFFLAFLPQFADARRGPIAPQVLFLGCLFVFNGFFVCAAYALLASRLGAWLESRWHVGTWLNRVSGTLFIGLGLKLALERR
ncbi:MAG TPA: LysE family translocator [Xanthomonadales bacterium]|nr:LysE family translocator [Xanthomonadales bacterium]